MIDAVVVDGSIVIVAPSTAVGSFPQPWIRMAGDISIAKARTCISFVVDFIKITSIGWNLATKLP